MPRYLSSVSTPELQRRSIRDLRLCLARLTLRPFRIRTLSKHLSEVLTLALKDNATYTELGIGTGGEGVARLPGAVNANQSPPDSANSQSLTGLIASSPPAGETLRGLVDGRYVDGVSSLTDSPESLKWALKERDVKIARLEAKVKELEGKAPGNPVLGGTVTNDLGNHPYTTPEPNLITLRPYDAPDKGAISTWTVGEVAPMDKPEGKPITANPEAATEVLTPEEGKMARKYLRALNSDLGTTTSWIELGRMVAVGELRGGGGSGGGGEGDGGDCAGGAGAALSGDGGVEDPRPHPEPAYCGGAVAGWAAVLDEAPTLWVDPWLPQGETGERQA